MNLILEAHKKSPEMIFKELNSSARGLSSEEADIRFKIYGPNQFPTKPAKKWFHFFFQQFSNPLTYILLAAALMSIFVEDYTDAFFIGVVLLVNAVIGTIQEYNAQKSALALQNMTSSRADVIRDNEIIEIDAIYLVPGDVILLESGKKVPADIRLISANSLEVDESLLTGESFAVLKDHTLILDSESSVGDQLNMAFMGSIVKKGRGSGLIISTGLRAQLGKIADSIETGISAKPPLLIRMEVFTKRIAVFLLVITALLGGYLISQGHSWLDVVLFSVALAVSAIPEGLPVAITVALSIASRRMSKRNVIVRKLPAVESLGSCTFIATDKTGTLTVNQLTITQIAIPETSSFSVSGIGINPTGEIIIDEDLNSQKLASVFQPLIISSVLCNEARLGEKENGWIGSGDAVDVAFLVLAHKAQILPQQIRKVHKLIEEIPFEPEKQYAASSHENENETIISVKGAFEKILPMCLHMNTVDGIKELNSESIYQQAERMAEMGFRVLALAGTNRQYHENLKSELHDLIFYGLVGMIDPLRDDAFEAIASCHSAGIEVAMVTGDHPKTALAIAKELKLANSMSEVITGPQIKNIFSKENGSQQINQARVFARVEPQQKLEIVNHLLGHGHFVAVTGDGANDAPAMKAANVAVAMGKSGTDVAKETADLIITDDRFASIVSGIEEGRIAYANIRKVIYLLISTGAAEICIFILSIIFDTPLPLTAIQLLWLNLVTNGIQHVGLAFEPAEGDELKKNPRKPNEPIFDRLMLERVGLSALTIGGISFLQFNIYIDAGVPVETARNMTLLLMVLFENIMVFNCRSEKKSAFYFNPLSNLVLLFGTIGAQTIHILAMYTPGLKDVLGMKPVELSDWLRLLLMAVSVLVVIEIYKFIRPRLHH